jgi:hypothetical protein
MSVAGYSWMVGTASKNARMAVLFGVERKSQLCPVEGACGHFDGLAANYKKHQTSRQKPNPYG